MEPHYPAGNSGRGPYLWIQPEQTGQTEQDQHPGNRQRPDPEWGS